jgi:dihydroxyacetone kinase-like protein
MYGVDTYIVYAIHKDTKYVFEEWLKMSVNSTQIINILNRIKEVIESEKLYLSELDAAIGDGDHGLNMSKGFNELVEKIKEDQQEPISNILKKSGMALISNVGGASGPLYGTAFMKAATVVEGKSQIDIHDFINMIEEALNGIKARGKSESGEKTMIDSIQPALEALKQSVNNDLVDDALKSMVEAAKEGVEYTKTIIATKGRASYLGERSIGHQDPGATSSYIILKTIYEEVSKL